MAYETRINRALEVAPDLDLSALNATDMTNIDATHESILRTDSAEELGVLLREAHAVLGKEHSESDIQDMITHEGEHASAWRMLGVISGFGIRLFNYDQALRRVNYSTFTIAINDHPITTLELASVSGYPTIPSLFDIDQVNRLGFSGIEELAEAAIASNGSGDRYIPVPLSYESSTGERVFVPERV